MDGESRRKEIAHALKSSSKAITASSLAKQYDVSRQVIVGDIALLRASGMDIMATSKGYLLPQQETGIVKTIASNHKPEDIEAELAIIINGGGRLLDVAVDHQIYGTITANLQIDSLQDIQDFLEKKEKLGASALSELTQGVHSHKICVENLAQFEQIVAQLDTAGFLFK